MSTTLQFTVNQNSNCRGVTFTDTTQDYDVAGGMVLASVTSASLAYTDLTGQHQGFIFEGTEFIPAPGEMSFEFNAPPVGIYTFLYTVTGEDDMGEPLTLTAEFVALNDCAVRACLKKHTLAAMKDCGCCDDCHGKKHEKLTWLWVQLTNVRLAFENGNYDCLGDILARLLKQCDDSCNEC